MARTHSLAWSQLKIGILAVAALGLATVLILAVGGQGGFVWERYALKTKFTDIAGLKTGAVVRVAGVDVGKVTDIQFTGTEVEVVLEVNESMQERITENSRASIGALSLLGEPLIAISVSGEGRRLVDGDFILSARAPSGIADMAAPLSAGVEEATKLIQDIRAGKGTVGKLMTDDAAYREFSQLLVSTESVVAGLNRGEGTAGKLLKSDAAYQQFNSALTNMNEMTKRIRAGEGSLGKLLADDAMAKSLTQTAANAEQISGRIASGQGTAGKLLNETAIYDRLDAITGRVDKLVASLESGQGTAGMLMKDKQLYDNMNSAASELKLLIEEIKKNPKKYLNVRVSIW